MANPAKPPRLKLRNGIYQIIDTAHDFRKSTGTSDLKKAEALLREYVMTASGYAPPDEPKVRDLLAMYRERKREEFIQRARRAAFDRAILLGLPETEGAKMADEAAQQVDKKVARGVKKDALQGIDVNISALNRHVGDLRICLINNQVARNYTTARRKDGKRRGGKIVDIPVADTTIHGELTTLKAALNLARKEDVSVWFGEKPVPDFHMPIDGKSRSRQYYLTHDEVRLLLERCNESHLRLYLLLAIQTGARKDACLGLRWTDVDFKNEIVDFGVVDHHKRRPRVKMTPILKQALWAAWCMRAVGSEYVIEYHGKPVGNIKKSFEALVRACGLNPRLVTPHVLKHTYISMLCASGLFRDITEIAELADTTVQTINTHYKHVAPDTAKRVAAAVDLTETGPADLGLNAKINFDTVDVRAKEAANDAATGTPPLKAHRPTRRELESGDRLTKNTRIPRRQAVPV